MKTKEKSKKLSQELKDFVVEPAHGSGSRSALMRVGNQTELMHPYKRPERVGRKPGLDEAEEESDG